MILTKLKEATREQHENLEKNVDIMSKMFSIDDYKGLLAKFYRFYAAIEPKVAENDVNVEGFNFDERRKTPLLTKDLAGLGILETVQKSELWNGLPALDTSAKAFGSIYVMEGATLGGQLITRHLKEHFNISPDNGGAFFNSYGPMVGPMWKGFGTAISTFAETADADDEIVQSAKDTFDSFRLNFVSE